MTLFKDPNDYNYVFYGAIIVLAVIGSLFFGEPADKMQNFINKRWFTLKPMVCDHPDIIINMMELLGEKPQMTMNNVSNQDGGVIKTIIFWFKFRYRNLELLSL